MDLARTPIPLWEADLKLLAWLTPKMAASLSGC